MSAVTSTPIYFPAVLLRRNPQGEDFVSDARLMLNAPGDIAYLHARSNVPEADEFIVISLGTRFDQYCGSLTPALRGGLPINVGHGSPWKTGEVFSGSGCSTGIGPFGR